MKSYKLLNEFMVRSDGNTIVIPAGMTLVVKTKNGVLNESIQEKSKPISKEIYKSLSKFITEHKRFTADFFDKKIGFDVSTSKLVNEEIKDLFYIYGYRVEDCGTHFQVEDLNSKFAFGSIVLNENETKEWVENEEKQILENAELRFQNLDLRKLNPGLSFVGDFSDSLDSHYAMNAEGTKFTGDEMMTLIPIEWVKAAGTAGCHVLQFIKDMGLAEYHHVDPNSYTDSAPDLSIPSNIEEITMDDIPL